MKAKKGDTVSLVTTKRAFYFQGEGGLNLGANGVDSGIIPNTVTDVMLEQINNAITNGDLIVGEVSKEPEQKSESVDLQSIVDLGRNKINEWIIKLMSDKNIKSSIKSERLEKMIEIEKLGKNRKSVLLSLEGAIKTIGGISKVTETDQQKIEIKLTSGNAEEQAE